MINVFIIDDSKAIRERLREMLVDIAGIEIIGESGDPAVALAEMQARRPDAVIPDAVIFDIRLPDISGIKLLRRIKREHPATRVMMLTNYPYPKYRQQSLAAGADYFFQKAPEFDPSKYDEAMLLYILGLGSPTHPLPESCYAGWTSTYRWEHFYGYEYLYAGPLFTHQLSHVWIDFRGIQDAFMRVKGIDYFENSRRATYVQQRKKTMQDDPHFGESPVSPANAGPLEAPLRVFSGVATPISAVQLLSNGRYHAMITNAGGGYSRWKDIALTRWREDSTRDNWGTFCYLRDVAKGAFWSTTYQPTLDPSAAYQANFSEACAAFRCYEQGINAHTEIAVSPEDDVEVRRIGITNRSGARKVIDLTSYAEVVLALAAADAAHPAFSNLFVQTEILREQQAILCNRRSGAGDHAALWMFHRMVPDESVWGDMSYETDRMRFIGRGNTLVNPQAMRDVAALSGSAGSVLDPIAAIQCRITLDPEQSATVAKGLTVDLVICNSEGAGSRQPLHDQVMALIAAGTEADLSDQPGGIFVRLAGPLSSEDRILLQSVACVVLDDRGRAPAEQINRRSPAESVVPLFAPARMLHAEPAAAVESSRGDLMFFNGLGGFTPDGREYVVTIAPGRVTPAPWVNVLANPLEAHPRRGIRGNARSIHQCAGQWLAGLSNHGVPPVGTERVLPVIGRFRFSRSTAGRDGTRSHRAGPGACAFAPLCIAPVQGRRCPALVASPNWPGCAYPLLG